MIGKFRTVNAILEQSGSSRPARKDDLGCGDYVVVTTENSIYSIQVLGDATYVVRGGWFDRQKMSPVTLTVAGCTWGGSVIKVDIVAGYGLHLEFGNRVLTSRIRGIRLVRASDQQVSMRPAEARELLRTCYGSRWQDSAAS